MILGMNLTGIPLSGALGDKLRDEFQGIQIVSKTAPTPIEAFETFKGIAERWCDFEGEFTDPERLAAEQVAQMFDIHWGPVEKLVVLYRDGELDVNHPLIDILCEKVDSQGVSIHCLTKGPGARPVWQKRE